MVLTESQLAARWQCSEYTLYEDRRAGRGCKFIIVGRSAIRYRLVDVEEHERSSTFQSMAQVYQAKANRARARAEHREALTAARSRLAEGRAQKGA